ncbi:hypothetical protein MLD38_019717 [Melastoma candidum]|uniref:Uncharacterized protein n=1 Tax=Melastoma candidum TaxID=119954 RepID=A0ACB9QY33_9MYRT|nr:hypothetical protein MLD38_019717 [Melastoma candidum]
MEMTNVLLLIVSGLVGAYVFLFGFLRKLNELLYVKRLGNKQYDLPPGDMGWPFVGKMLSFSKSLKSRDPDSFISSFASRYGAVGIYKTFMHGAPSIIVCSSETCRRVLADEENFKMSYPVMTRRLGGGKTFHSMSNSEHKYYRRLTAAVINGSDTLSMYIRHIEDVMIASLDKWSSEDQPVEFATEMKKPAFKVILPIFCGSEADSMVERLIYLFDEIKKGLGFPRINFPGFKFHRSVQAKEELTEILMEALSSLRSAAGNFASGVGRSLMDILLTSKDEDGLPLSDYAIHDLVYMYLSAGFESTTTATMLTLFFLHENPDMLEKAKEEQVQILKKRDSTQTGFGFHEIKQMEYLSKVIDEMLRFMGGYLFREAKSDVTINGYLVPKGWKVLVWLRAVHMNPDNYEEPKEFNPSRWENPKRKGGTFIPFGAGSRFCPGSDLAKLEICIFLHHFLLNYKLERINPGSPIIYTPGPLPADKFLVRFKKA